MSKAPETKERPILMNAPMVRAVLDGTKTQTRQISRFCPMRARGQTLRRWQASSASSNGRATKRAKHQPPTPAVYRCPFGVPGTRLWVRETLAAQGTGVGSGLIRIKDRIRQAYMADMESRSCC